jgi:hypothetical protein
MKNQVEIPGSTKPSFFVGFLRQKRTVHTALVPRNNPEALKMPTTPVSHKFLNEFLTSQYGHLPFKKFP